MRVRISPATLLRAHKESHEENAIIPFMGIEFRRLNKELITRRSSAEMSQRPK